MNKTKVFDEFLGFEKELETHVSSIESIVHSNNNNGFEGNSFYVHETFTRLPELVSKQGNLFWAGSTAKTRICEIGFNAGHSAILMLLQQQNPIEFTIFDICDHQYVKPCFEYIKNKFQHVKYEFIEGNSIVEMPKWIEKNPHLLESYDVIHVDGGHSEECIQNDLKNSVKLLKLSGLLIIDDTNDTIINNYVDKCLSTGFFEEVDVFLTSFYCHRILRRIC